MNTQVISIASSLGDSAPASSRRVTARPTPGQFIDQRLIDQQVLQGSTGSDGSTTLTLIQGVTYEVVIAGWGTQVITVSPAAGTTQAPYSFLNYLQASSGGDSALPTANFITAGDGTVWQMVITDNGDGTYSQSFVRVA